MRYKVFDPESQVLGQTMLGFKAAADQVMIQPLLEKSGLVDIQPDQWYPLQTWLDVFSGMSAQMSDYASMIAYVNIGQKVAANIFIPAEIEAASAEDPEKFLEIMSAFTPLAYKRDHRGDVGEFLPEKVSARHVRVAVRTPYPPDYWYGGVHGFVRRFCNSFIVHYEDISMRHAASGETVVVHIVVE